MPLARALHRGGPLDRPEAELHPPVRRGVPRDHPRGVAARPSASTTSRCRGATPRPAASRCRLWVDGEPAPRLGRRRGRASSAPTRAVRRRAVERRLHALGRRARSPEDDAERAITLRRACDIGMGRGMDLDAIAGRRATSRARWPACVTRCSRASSRSRSATSARSATSRTRPNCSDTELTGDRSADERRRRTAASPRPLPASAATATRSCG